ncbi:MAG: SGNH/GDSL hydrolase family protein [Lentisphaerae bacterium]|nr:SGNH/GDSL hydrolase family protein [Lentisphaerota bacterium]
MRTVISFRGALHGTRSKWEYVLEESGRKRFFPYTAERRKLPGRIQSAIFSLDKAVGTDAYYRLTFTCEAEKHCYWWIDYYDGAGQLLPDCNGQVLPGQKRYYDEVVYVNRLAVSAQLAFVSKGAVRVADISLRKITARQAAEWCDRIAAQLPGLDFQAPQDAFRDLPRTALALQNGTPWNIVMLGDSIVNDTYHSVFQALISREFPRSRTNFVNSVRGGTGCWYFCQEENFQEYIQELQPDLLLIGGISNLNYPSGLDDLAAVANRVRSAGCECAIMSPGPSLDWRVQDASAPAAHLPASDWLQSDDRKYLKIYQQERELALAQNLPFWDISIPVNQYRGQSGMPWGHFNRDPIHSNTIGKQQLGRIMLEFFKTAKMPPDCGPAKHASS